MFLRAVMVLGMCVVGFSCGAALSPAPASRADDTAQGQQQRSPCSPGTVVGEVVSVGAVQPGAFATEHDPLWQQATLDAACGGCAGLIDVYFASSVDVAWWSSPKLTVGQRDVFVLEAAGVDQGLPAGALVVRQVSDAAPTCP